ncbi:MAG: hypothetical protein ABI895_40955 [Deltaproteobacteria bacterium]
MREELAICVLPHPQFLVILWLHTDVDPPTSQWTAAIEQLLQTRRERGLSIDRVRSLVITDGAAPNAAQRIEVMRDLHEGLPNKLAVLTLAMSNPIKRGIATALSWVNPAIRFYRPTQFREALVYLDLADQSEAIRREYQRLNARLNGLVRLVDHVSF